MHSREPRTARRVLFGALVLAFACGAVLVHWLRRVPRFEYSARTLSSADYRALGSEGGFKVRAIDVGEGISLRGIERLPADGGQPGVLLFEGNSAHLLADGQRFLGRLLKGRGWGGAVFAYRGFDGNEGIPGPEALERDAFKVYAQIKRDWQLPASRIHLVGFSLGTSVVAAIAARSRDEPPGSVTLLASTTRLDMVPPGGGSRQRYETLKYLDAFASPVLVVHGRRDQVLPVEGGRTIAAKLGDRARYVEDPGLGHHDLHESRSVTDRVRAFVDAHDRGGN
ncbi:MAG TPA: alpha/beta hydrolase [Polyangiaceae bacterium]